MLRKHTKSPAKIQQALELLNEAARDKRDELYEVLESQYDDLRKVVGNVSTSLLEKTGEIKERTESVIHNGQKKIEESVSNTAERVTESVKKHPWGVLGVLAAGAFVLGVRASSKKRSKK
jgi:ElaB/YqjD/DUF883 family membrane-anchored ribosome-binding protein